MLAIARTRRASHTRTHIYAYLLTSVVNTNAFTQLSADELYAQKLVDMREVRQRVDAAARAAEQAQAVSIQRAYTPLHPELFQLTEVCCWLCVYACLFLVVCVCMSVFGCVMCVMCVCVCVCVVCVCI